MLLTQHELKLPCVITDSKEETHIVLLQDLQSTVDIVEGVNTRESSLQPHLHARTYRHTHTHTDY